MDRGSVARVRLIEVAERLFAERGIHGVSMREIGARAGQRNTAAVRYHFGSKQALVTAIFHHRMVPINARRLAMLDEFDRQGRGQELRALAEAYLYPLSEMLGTPERPSWYLRFCTHAGYVEGTAPTDLGRQEWTRSVQVVRRRLERALSQLPEGARASRWNLFAGYMSHALADCELLIQQGRSADPDLPARALFLAELVDTAVALVSAPVSETTQGEIDAVRRRGIPDPGHRAAHNPSQERRNPAEASPAHPGGPQ